MTKKYQFQELYAFTVVPLLWILIVVPSSFLASIKILLLLAVASFFFLHHYSRKTVFPLGQVMALALIVLFLGIQLFRGFIETGYQLGGPLKSLSSIMLVVFIASIVTLSLRSKMLSYSTLTATIGSAVVFYCVIKLLLFVLKNRPWLLPLTYQINFHSE